MQRLNPIDAQFVDAEDQDRHASFAIASTAVFEGPPPSYGEFLDAISARLPLVPISSRASRRPRSSPRSSATGPPSSRGVPAIFVALLACPELDSCDISSLRIAISGGASIPAPVLDAFEKRFGVLILEGYGLTETASTTTFNVSATDRRIYSVGKPIWGTQTPKNALGKILKDRLVPR
jgi:acyl-CoA synthetase (AMP-forming)/AMP-acid ligase II